MPYRWRSQTIFSADILKHQELFQSVVGLSMAAGIFAALEVVRGLFSEVNKLLG